MKVHLAALLVVGEKHTRTFTSKLPKHIAN